MLNKGLRDEESIRIDNVLKTLLSIVFVPYLLIEEDKINIENQLKNLDLNIQILTEIEPNDLIGQLLNCKLDWNNLEQFADFLIAFSNDKQFNFSEKAIAIYNHVQSESKTFSFEISNKIALAKANYK